MKSVDLNSKWSIAVGDERFESELPFDATAGAARDYSCAFGELSGYIPAAAAVFTRELPQIKSGNAALVISGACGYGNVYVNDERIGIIDSYGPLKFFIPNGLADAHNSVRIELFTEPAMSDKYIGLGIAGGVKLVVADALYDIYDNSLFVKTLTVGDRVYADVQLFVYNNDSKPNKFVLDCTALNARGKRAGKKQRKITLRSRQSKAVALRVRINNPYEWSISDPYMYTVTARLIGSDGGERVVSTRFGIVSRTLNGTRGLYINNRKTLLFGAYVAHSDAALGAVSVYSNEKRRLQALKSLGYNAVHYVDCPVAAALDACDDVGMYAFVDLFSHLGKPKAPLGGIFADAQFTAESKVEALRNHPCVAMYGIADDVPECYGRDNGYGVISMLAQTIRGLDDTRPITVSASELVPTRKELEQAGCKHTVFAESQGAINAGREKNLFDNLTRPAFDSVDVCGFNYLYPMYETDRIKHNRLIVGARTSADRAFESVECTEKNDRVIGDFGDCGIDYLGGGKLNEIIVTRGDLDAICTPKPQGVYKRVLLGGRGITYIVAHDPDTGEATHVWNWPRYLGQKIDVEVYTSGDVVALYLDGRIVGRKLAGKVNKQVASFKVDYYPGELVAVAYFKGVECGRDVLRSASSPKTIKLSAYEKNLSVSRGDLGFVTAEVCDRDGNLVPYAMRSLSATVTGGTLVSFVNADPMLRKNSFDSCPAYGGRALAVVKPDPAEAKVSVKITGDGLLASRVSFKIKN